MGLNDLAATPIKDEVDFGNLPEQMSASQPPPQPGAYRFKLPKLTGENFNAVTTTDYGQRVSVKFDDSAPLTIVQSTNPDMVGTPFKTQLSNVPRARNREKTVFASDWDYLNQALGVAARPKSNRDYANVLMAKAAEGAEFSGDLEWSWHANPTRAARFSDGQGGFAEALDTTGQPIMGSGQRFYQKDIELKGLKVNGQWPLYIEGDNGEQIRAFANIARFRA